jgi:hypothetical protein
LSDDGIVVGGNAIVFGDMVGQAGLGRAIVFGKVEGAIFVLGVKGLSDFEGDRVLGWGSAIALGEEEGRSVRINSTSNQRIFLWYSHH